MFDPVFVPGSVFAFDVPVDPADPLEPSTLSFLLWNRFCERVQVDGCVDPSRVGLAPASFGIALEVDRLRIKTRRRGAKLRVSGSLDLGDVPLPEDGSFSISVGAFFASVPLEDFQRRGRLRIWRGRGKGRRCPQRPVPAAGCT